VFFNPATSARLRIPWDNVTPDPAVHDAVGNRRVLA
jgi:hypothetical protein